MDASSSSRPAPAGPRGRDRELAQQGADVGRVAGEDERPLPLERRARHLGGDEGVAVAVAADPGAEAEEGRDAEGDPGPLLGQAALELAVDGRDHVEERALEDVQAGPHLVERAWGARSARCGWRPIPSPPRAGAPPAPPAPGRRPADRRAPSRSRETRARWSSTVRRRASVGCAVSTGITSRRSSSACTSSAMAPPAAARRRRPRPTRPPGSRRGRGPAAPGSGAAPRPR